MRILSFACGISLALTSGLAVAQTKPAPTTAPQPPKYSSSTTPLGVLMANPAAKAVLVKYIPEMVDKPEIEQQASGMTLRELREAVKTYAPDLLPDKMLASIDEDLAKVPPAK